MSLLTRSRNEATAEAIETEESKVEGNIAKIEREIGALCDDEAALRRSVNDAIFRREVLNQPDEVPEIDVRLAALRADIAEKRALLGRAKDYRHSLEIPRMRARLAELRGEIAEADKASRRLADTAIAAIRSALEANKAWHTNDETTRHSRSEATRLANALGEPDIPGRVQFPSGFDGLLDGCLTGQRVHVREYESALVSFDRRVADWARLTR